MNDWLTIGQFAKQAGISPRALRLYEREGLLLSHSRGENNYRYYKADQIGVMNRIQQFKSVGFSLNEIKLLLKADASMDVDLLKEGLKRRLDALNSLEANLSNQKRACSKILASLDGQKLNPTERKYIMSRYQHLLVVITGLKNLEATASYLSAHLDAAKILKWSAESDIPSERPLILIVEELLLPLLPEISPDLVIINNITSPHQGYDRLFRQVDSHVTTVFNADDRISIELAKDEEIRKGRIFYYSKNQSLTSQIESIGGVVSDGEQINMYKFNLEREPVRLEITEPQKYDVETAYLASLAGILDVGLSRNQMSEIKSNLLKSQRQT